MRIIAAIVIVGLAASLYSVGFGGKPDAPYTLGTAAAQLLFVMSAFAAIALLARSIEKDAIWPWHWPILKRSAPGYQAPDRRRGDRRRSVAPPPEGLERRLTDRRRAKAGNGSAAHCRGIYEEPPRASPGAGRGETYRADRQRACDTAIELRSRSFRGSPTSPAERTSNPNSPLGGPLGLIEMVLRSPSTQTGARRRSVTQNVARCWAPLEKVLCM